MSGSGENGTVCANPDCRVAETGKCVEGLETGKCPHFGRPRAATSGVPDDEGSGIPMLSGGTLSIADTSMLLRQSMSKVIAVIGPSDAGKTSLIASLYDLFQDGPVAGAEFAGSLSLYEFENVCHDARAASRRGTPHIRRTPRGEVKFYHLRLGYGQPPQSVELALADRAGEEYRAAIEDVSVVSTFVEVSRADALTILVDGSRLLDIGARHNLRSEIELILQALSEAGCLTSLPRLGIVLTKIDLIEGSQEKDRVLSDFDDLVSSIKRLFGSLFLQVLPFRIAASPKSPTTRRGAGIAELLTFWLEPTPSPITVPTVAPSAGRVFGRLKLNETAGSTP